MHFLGVSYILFIADMIFGNVLVVTLIGALLYLFSGVGYTFLDKKLTAKITLACLSILGLLFGFFFIFISFYGEIELLTMLGFIIGLLFNLVILYTLFSNKV